MSYKNLSTSLVCSSISCVPNWDGSRTATVSQNLRRISAESPQNLTRISAENLRRIYAENLSGISPRPSRSNRSYRSASRPAATPSPDSLQPGPPEATPAFSVRPESARSSTPPDRRPFDRPPSTAQDSGTTGHHPPSTLHSTRLRNYHRPPFTIWCCGGISSAPDSGTPDHSTPSALHSNRLRNYRPPSTRPTTSSPPPATSTRLRNFSTRTASHCFAKRHTFYIIHTLCTSCDISPL